LTESALVTGAAGFIGASLVRRLLADGHTVTAAVRPGGDGWRLRDVRNDVRLIELDLREPGSVRKAFADARPEWVFHLAAHGAYSWQDDPAEIMRTGVLGFVNVIEAGVAAGVRTFVNAGSSSEYGFTTQAPSESALPEPNSAYAVAKVAATAYGQWVAREREQAVTTLRLYSVYGPWEDPRRLIPVLVAHGVRGVLPPLVDPAIARDFVHVDDACEAFVQAARAAAPGAGRIYNVASGVQTTLRDLVQVARQAFGVTDEPDWGTYGPRSWDTTTWVGDPELIRREVGWSATRSLSDGLRDFATWMRSEGELARRYGVAPA
jgi:dolichol-phosphate mannosyltransferase